MRKLSAAVVGAGFIGPVHVEALRRLGRRVVGVLGSTPAKSREAAALMSMEKAYASYDEVLGDDEVDVVHITSPNRTHFDYARRAIEAGKHVMCEKPLAINSQETAELAELAEQSSVATAVCYNVRYYPLCQEARIRVARRQLGPVLHVTGSYLQDWLLFMMDYSWRVLGEQGGPLRAVADIGTHWLDLVQYITGLKVESVCADLQIVHPERRRPPRGAQTFTSVAPAIADVEPVEIDTEDAGFLLLRFDNGARGCLAVSQTSAGRKNCLRFDIAGGKASMAWDSQSPNELWLGERDAPNLQLLRDPTLFDAESQRAVAYPGGHNEGFADTFKHCFRDFYESIEEDQSPHHSPQFATFADGHQEALLCEAVLKSHQTRAWADVRPQAKTPPEPSDKTDQGESQ